MSMDDVKNTTHRFADVAGEPCITLLPIEGYSKKPLVTLEEAVKPLKRTVVRLDGKIYALKIRAANPAHDLTEDESAAIALYTVEWEPYDQSLYYILNTSLRTEDRQRLRPWFLYLKLLFTALSRLPIVSNTTIYRGVRFTNVSDYEKYCPNEDFIWWGFSSCSTSRTICEREQFLGTTGHRILFIINCIDGRDIGLHSYFRKESEILLLPATRVRVISHEYQENGLQIVHLQQLESPAGFLEPVDSDETPTPTERLSTITNFRRRYSITAELEKHVNPRVRVFMARCKPRSEMHLTGRRYREDELETIFEKVIIHKQCPELSLNESRVTSRGITVIADALTNEKNVLERLLLSHNQIGDEGARILAEALTNNPNSILKELSLCDNGITDVGVGYLADMLETNITLTHLWLGLNEIHDQGLQRLVGVLKNKNGKLQVLSLERNKYHIDTNVDIILDMLKSNSSLIELNLRSSKTSKSTVRQLTSDMTDKSKCTLLL